MAQSGNDAMEPVVDQCVTIVTAYVSNNAVPISDLPGLIDTIHRVLTQLRSGPVQHEMPRPAPPVPIRRTVTPDAIISLEDGKPYKTLKRHLAGRGLSPDQYRQKWGLPSDYPMVASNYAAQRSELAKTAGLGRRRATFRSGGDLSAAATRSPSSRSPQAA